MDDTWLQIKLVRRYPINSRSLKSSPDFYSFGYFNEIYINSYPSIKSLFIDAYSTGLEVGAEIQYLYLAGDVQKVGKIRQLQKFLKNKEKPLLLISGIKFRNGPKLIGGCTTNGNELPELLENQLKVACIEKDLDARIFWGLGFCEFFLLWKTKAFRDVMATLQILRKNIIASTNNQLDFIYSVPGFPGTFDLKKENPDFMIGLASLSPSMSRTIEQITGNDQVFSIFGAHDFVIKPNEKNLNNLNMLDTYIGYEIMHNDLPSFSEESIPQYRSSNLREKIETIIQINQQEGYLTPTHILELKNLLLFFSNIEYSHSVDDYLMDEWLLIIERFIVLVKTSLSEWNCLCKGSVASIVLDQRKKGFVISYELAIQNINAFVRSWIRGTKATLESPIQSSFHTGGISKITYFYTKIINQVEVHFNQIAKLRGHDNNHNNDRGYYQFFAVPSWESATESLFLFDELTTNKNWLIPIKIRIEDYFNFDSIGILFHEIGHYYPSKKDERNTLLLKLVLESVSMAMAEFIFSELLDSNIIIFEYDTFYGLIIDLQISIENVLIPYFSDSLKEEKNKPIPIFCEALTNILLTTPEMPFYELLVNDIVRVVAIHVDNYLKSIDEEKELISESLHNKGWKYNQEQISQMDYFSYMFSNSISKINLRPDQRNGFKKHIYTFFTKPIADRNASEKKNFTSYFDIVTKEVTNFQELLKEIKADYFMCKILDLSRDQYHKIVDELKRADPNIDYKDTLLQKELRKRILEATKIFPGSAPDPGWATSIANVIISSINKEELEGFYHSPIISLCREYCSNNYKNMSSFDLIISVLGGE